MCIWYPSGEVTHAHVFWVLRFVSLMYISSFELVHLERKAPHLLLVPG